MKTQINPQPTSNAGKEGNDEIATTLDSFYEWKLIKPSGTIFAPRTGHTVAHVNGKVYLFAGIINAAQNSVPFFNY